ncbi:glyoxalase superfamily protein [Verrucomicrobium sp. BvORR034]|uniref:glyoxalase superfamily protein n=1 Tax=Verrucomicrobium sp. BvORR034 TaxID=1396418 RepID=UPI0006785787|nr:glyoxalase superfamily protein [Verrucomicrobium sp. BvORR034]
MKAQQSATVFQVSNLEAALKHYVEVLGFTEDFRFGEYAGVTIGDVCVHLCAHSIHQRPVGGGTVCIFADEVDSYYREIQAKGAQIKAEPRDYPYGMRDFMVVDPDGNHLSFGCEVKSE